MLPSLRAREPARLAEVFAVGSRRSSPCDWTSGAEADLSAEQKLCGTPMVRRRHRRDSPADAAPIQKDTEDETVSDSRILAASDGRGRQARRRANHSGEFQFSWDLSCGVTRRSARGSSSCRSSMMRLFWTGKPAWSGNRHRARSDRLGRCPGSVHPVDRGIAGLAASDRPGTREPLHPSVAFTGVPVADRPSLHPRVGVLLVGDIRQRAPDLAWGVIINNASPVTTNKPVSPSDGVYAVNRACDARTGCARMTA